VVVVVEQTMQALVVQEAQEAFPEAAAAVAVVVHPQVVEAVMVAAVV